MKVNPRRALIIGGGVAGPVLALFLKRSGFDAQVFEASSGPADTGEALGLAANRMNFLAAAGVIEQVRDVSVTADEWAFENHHGKLLACMPSGDPARYGQAPVLITRAAASEFSPSCKRRARVQGRVIQLARVIFSHAPRDSCATPHVEKNMRLFTN